jgi:hypothetical protein
VTGSASKLYLAGGISPKGAVGFLIPETPLPQVVQLHGKWLFFQPFIEPAEHYEQT